MYICLRKQYHCAKIESKGLGMHFFHHRFYYHYTKLQVSQVKPVFKTCCQTKTRLYINCIYFVTSSPAAHLNISVKLIHLIFQDEIVVERC